jgi:DNA-directed RNA polymerase
MKEMAADLSAQLIDNNPVLIPTTEQPRPWTTWRDGGYQNEQARASVTFVRGAASHNPKIEQAISAAFKSGTIRQHADGVNALQSVPYRINAPVLEALKRYGDRLDPKKVSKEQFKYDIAVAERLRGAPFYVPLNCDFRDAYIQSRISTISAKITFARYSSLIAVSLLAPNRV